MLLLGFVTLLKDEIEDLERKKSELDLLQIGLFIRFIFQKLSMIIVELIGQRWFPTQYQGNNLPFVLVWYFVPCKPERINNYLLLPVNQQGP